MLIMTCEKSAFSFWIHIPVGSCITLLCLLGNVPLLWIYARNKQTLKKKVFEVSFAVVDIVACVVYLHMLPFIGRSIAVNPACDSPLVYRIAVLLVTPFCVSAYSVLCLGVSIDRFNAVYFPIGYSSRRPRMLAALMAGCCVYTLSSVVDIFVNPFWVSNQLKRAFWFGLLVIMLVVMSVLYSAIILKLWSGRIKRSRKVAPVKTQTEVEMQNG